MNETWKPIPGYETYEASDQGRIRSTDRLITDELGRERNLKGQVIKPWKINKGHLTVAISNKQGQKRFLVHRLVMAAFNGSIDDPRSVLHWNDNPEDNRLSNLRYGNQSENMTDSVRNGHNVNYTKDACPRGHKLQEPNLVPSIAKYGGRSCLACSRTKGYIGNHPELRDQFKLLSDSYYESIVAGTYQKRRSPWLTSTRQTTTKHDDSTGIGQKAPV